MINIKKGFTLIELILVVAILALVGLIGVPRISKAINVFTLQSEAQRLKIWMRRAKYEAITTGNTYRVDFISPSSTKFRVQYFDKNDNNLLKTIENFDFAKGITARTTRVWLDFDPFGAVSGGMQRIDVLGQEGIRPRTIMITRAGRIK